MVLAGGGAGLPGLGERLKAALQPLAPPKAQRLAPNVWAETLVRRRLPFAAPLFLTSAYLLFSKPPRGSNDGSFYCTKECPL